MKERCEGPAGHVRRLCRRLGFIDDAEVQKLAHKRAAREKKQRIED
jgi:hypothetical protein